jgi:hypothetical protein
MAMLQVPRAENSRVVPCPGLLDDAGAVRDGCRACGRCDDLIRDMMADIVIGVGRRQTEAGAITIREE